MKKIILSIFCCSCLFNVTLWADTIILQDGEVITGKIINQNDNFISIQTESNIQQVNKQYIKRMVTETQNPEDVDGVDQLPLPGIESEYIKPKLNEMMKDRHNEEPQKELEYKSAQENFNLGVAGKENTFFIEGEVFTVGGADKEWQKNFDDFMELLKSNLDYAAGEMTTYPGVGVTLGVNMAPYKSSPPYIALSYIKGPSADTDVSISDSYYGSGGYKEELTTSFYRVVLGYKFVMVQPNDGFFVFDVNAGFGGGSINSEWEYTQSGSTSSEGSLSESWTGFTWSIGPTFSWELPGCVFELGGRYTSFPELKDGDDFSDVIWKPFSVKASLLF